MAVDWKAPETVAANAGAFLRILLHRPLIDARCSCSFLRSVPARHDGAVHLGIRHVH